MPPTAAHIRLRMLELADRGWLVDAFEDDDVRAYMVDVPAGRDAVDLWIGEALERWRASEAWPLVIERADRRPAGLILLSRRGPGASEAEVRYLVVASARRQGIARAALTAAAGRAFRDLDLTRLELTVHPENRASLRAADAAGFRVERRLVGWRSTPDGRRDSLLLGVDRNR